MASERGLHSEWHTAHSIRHPARTVSGARPELKGKANQALEQTRDSVLRYGAVVGCELLNFFVLS
jgi:hypothetical protein